MLRPSDNERQFKTSEELMKASKKIEQQSN